MCSSAIHSLILARLSQGLPGVTISIGQMLAEACAYCFDCHQHGSGVELRVEGTSACTVTVCWDQEITEQIRNAWDDQQDATEFGACGLAFLLILELTKYTVIRRARKGTGFDYWLGTKNDTELPFQDTARLEISGIFKGDSSTIRARVNKKKQQTNPTDGCLPAYIVVVEFGQPVSHMVQK